MPHDPNGDTARIIAALNLSSGSPPSRRGPGNMLDAGGLPAYRIVDVVPLADIDEYAGIWTVDCCVPTEPLDEGVMSESTPALAFVNRREYSCLLWQRPTRRESSWR
jgi:hypothetical protein